MGDLGERLSWRALWAMVNHAGPETALYHHVHGEQAAWSPGDHLLALVAELLANANWQRGGGKGSRPKPIPRPGASNDGTTKHFGNEAVPVAEFNAFWDKGG